MVIGRRPAAPGSVSLLVRQRVLVTLDTPGADEGYRGVAWCWDDAGLVLCGAADERVVWFQPSGDRSEVDGMVFVPRERVKAIQVLGAPGAG